MRELRESIARQYGPQLAPERLARQPLVGRPQAASPDREQAMRDYRQTVIKLYGPRPSRSVSGR